MEKNQFHVLYREFLFRLVDRELLSLDAQGDASKLLGRFAAILIFLSLPFTGMVLGVGNGHRGRDAILISAWGAEHALVATTMLVVGLFGVLSWESVFPDVRDVLILTPLPLRLTTIFLAKLAALAVALSLVVITFNAGPSIIFPVALAPPDATLLDIIVSPGTYRTLAAYWITMFAAGGFVLCCLLAVQGIAAQLPRRLFLRLSALIQITAFCLLLCWYFLQPSLTSPRALAASENWRWLVWLPSYWFFGLFQQLNGTPNNPARGVLFALANRAWIALGLALASAGLASVLSYRRTLRKIVEQPDISPGVRRLRWLPRFGNALETAVTQFSIRTLLRSRQHRMIVSFYLGAGFAVAVLFLKTPLAQKLSAASASDPWHQAGVPLLASSLILMFFWALGVRIAFAIPFELRANWIFRITQLRTAAEYFAASRRAIYALVLGPMLTVSAALFFSLWPWHQAAGHIAVLLLLGITLAELCLYGFRKIPFSCSYLPGKTNLHIAFCLWLMLGLNLTYWSANLERRALSDPTRFTWTIVILAATAVCATWRTTQANMEDAHLHFEEELSPAITSLGLHRDGVLPVE